VRDGADTKTDHVVGWGAFPVYNAGFDVVKGKYKVPFLRGEFDPSIHKFSEITQRLTQNVDNWLCNCYFDVDHKSRYVVQRHVTLT
jgi:hypothetical protein